MAMAKSPRLRIQRAFLRWLRANASRFSVPVKVIRRTHRCIDIGLENLNPCVNVFLTWEIGVEVSWQGECWDFLTFFEAAPEKTPQGYVCKMCEPEARTLYPSREALWTDHLFEPFLAWINDELVPARWLALYGARGKSTAAWLEKTRPEDEHGGDAQVWLPLWMGPDFVNQRGE